MRLRGFWIIGLVQLLLTSCVIAVVVGAAAGVIVYDRRSLAVMDADLRIHHAIERQLAGDLRFKSSRIVPVSFNRVVLLLGQTPTVNLRNIVQRIAQNTARVVRIHNEIHIGHSIALQQQTKDTWITSQVRSAMLTKKNLESGSIRIVTENGIVYLMGIVTIEQSNFAIAVARRINGVQKVVKVFQYVR